MIQTNIEASTSDASKFNGLTEAQYRELCNKYPAAPSSKDWVDDQAEVLDRGAGDFTGVQSTFCICEKCGKTIGDEATTTLEGYREFWVQVKVESPDGDWWKWEHRREARANWFHRECCPTVGVEKLDRATAEAKLRFKELLDSEPYTVMVNAADTGTIRILENAGVHFQRAVNFVGCDHVVAIDKKQAVDWLMEGQEDIIPLYSRSQE